MKLIKLTPLLTLLAVPFLSAEVKLPSVIGSHMVLQQDEPVPIWGWADKSEEVSVTFAGKTYNTQADCTTGNWKVELDAAKANSKGQKMVIKGHNEIVLEDILIGEVWLCSGQSNMEWSVARSANAQEEIANGKHPLIRHIKVPHRPSDKAETDVATQGWTVCSPETVANFTAVGYYFARHIQGELNVPVGLLGSNWGGTRIDPWIPPVGYKSVPALKADFAEKLNEFPTKNGNRINHQSPLALYNGMISPLVPYGIRGALWYQGESNNGEGMLYHEKMKALINGWRSLWNKDDLPFYYVQLAPFNYRNRSGEALAGIWQAQLATLAVPNTGMAVTTDITTVNNIHPPNKQDVGKRLALWALAKDYGKKDITYTGPLFSKVEAKGGELIVHFQDGTAEGLITQDCQKASHFEVSGKDGKWVPALAKIEGKTIVLTAEGVKEPTQARFGWDQQAVPNLFNEAGLPASPFHSSFK